MTAIDLTPFCTRNDIRHCLNHIHPLLGGVVACNGHVLIFSETGSAPPVPDEAKLTVERIPDFEKFVRLAQEQDFSNATPVSTLSLAGYMKCPRCKGKGSVIKHDCDDCDGEGEFDHGRHCYQCKECNGRGVVGDDGAEHTACPECCGSRVRSDSVPFGGVENFGINTSYVHLLQTLPDCVIAWADEKTIAFRFTGGCGVVMAIKGGAHHLRGD